MHFIIVELSFHALYHSRVIFSCTLFYILCKRDYVMRSCPKVGNCRLSDSDIGPSSDVGVRMLESANNRAPTFGQNENKEPFPV